jgi:hypothetical protein
VTGGTDGACRTRLCGCSLPGRKSGLAVVRALVALAVPVAREWLVAHVALELLHAEMRISVTFEVLLRSKSVAADVTTEACLMLSPPRARFGHRSSRNLSQDELRVLRGGTRAGR